MKLKGKPEPGASFNEQAEWLISDATDLIKQVLVKHSAAVLEEMRDQIVARNDRILELELRNADIAQLCGSYVAKLAAAETDAECMRISVMEMWNDWKNGDFDLPELAKLDLRAVMNAAEKGWMLERMDAEGGKE